MEFPPNYWLVASSQAFLIPAILSYNVHVYTTTSIYLFLWLSSIYYHSTKSLPAFYIDQVAVWLAVVRSFVDGYNTYPYGILCTLVVHGYNYYVFVHAKHCWSPDFWISTSAHAGIHIFTSIAVTIQMLLT